MKRLFNKQPKKEKDSTIDFPHRDRYSPPTQHEQNQPQTDHNHNHNHNPDPTHYSPSQATTNQNNNNTLPPPLDTHTSISPPPPTPSPNTQLAARKLFGALGRRNSTTVKPTRAHNGTNGNPVAPEPYEQARNGWTAGAGGAAAQVGPDAMTINRGQQQQSLRPPRVDNVTGVIGWSCAAEHLDYPLILSLCDHISLSAAASKEAAKALRKEIKYAVPDAQERAVRLLGIMMRNSDLRFKQQIASKKFLDELKELTTNKKTEPRVVNMVFRVLCPLAYEYQRDAELSPITTLWNKLKPLSAPVNGAPLDPDDSLFTPTMDPRRGQQGGRGGRGGGGRRIPTQTEALGELREVATNAKGNAAMLHEAVAYTPAHELSRNELVAEFYAKCLSDQQLIASNLDWATVQAEQARSNIRKNSMPLSPAVGAPHLASNNPFASHLDPALQSLPSAPAVEEETEEEKTLALLLAANSDVNEALHLHDHRLRLFHDSMREDSDLSAATEASKAETRFDRAAAGAPDANGNYLSPTDFEHGEGTSRSPSPNHSGGSGDEGASGKPSDVTEKGKSEEGLKRRVSLNPYASYVPKRVLQGYIVPENPPNIDVAGRSRRGQLVEEPAEERDLMDLGVDRLGVGSGPVRRQGTTDSFIETPSQPSEKALGKLRRVSMRTDSDPLEQQRQLEAKLREKYSQNFRDDTERRSGEFERQ
ncbi:hypothetical protein P7C70_g5463, partial [Phenoliferia sp. Uapishka_3]